jgi:hypothetical protein
MNKPMEYLALYSRNCKFCKALDPTEPKQFNCHFSQGNTQCPASEVRFAVVGKALRWASLVNKARIERDASKEAKVLVAVGEQSKAFQTKFYDELKRLEQSCQKDRVQP